MKKIIIFLNFILVVAMVCTIVSVKPHEYKTVINCKTNYVNSDAIKKESIEEVVIVEEVSSPLVETYSKEESKEETEEYVEIEKEGEIEEETKEEESLSKIETSDISTQTFTGRMSGYGSDIGTHTNSGYCISDTITYPDKTYGEVRILASGDEYPFGTIVSVSNSNEGSFIGIVLDRGPDIGLGEDKKFAFDLLYETSLEAYQKGVSQNAKFEILRIGF